MTLTPEIQAAMAAAFREYLSVHDKLDLSGRLKDEISSALVNVATAVVDEVTPPATPEEIAAAAALHGCDEISFDDDARAARSESCTWVSGWLRVANPDL